MPCVDGLLTLTYNIFLFKHISTFDKTVLIRHWDIKHVFRKTNHTNLEDVAVYLQGETACNGQMQKIAPACNTERTCCIPRFSKSDCLILKVWSSGGSGVSQALP